jgi:phosphoglycerate dehydrogenase-like enzyme
LKFCVPERIEDQHLANLPAGVEVVKFTREGELPAGLAEVEFFVPPFGQRARVREALVLMKRLKVIQTMSAGVDTWLDLVPPGVILCDGRGVHDVPVAEWCAAALLAMVKRFPEFRDFQARSDWKDERLVDLAGQRIMIYGYGSIGHALEERLAPFGVEFVRVARTPRQGVHGHGEVGELLPGVDAVVVLVPLTPETEGVVSTSFLARMKEGAILVNAARGRIVDTGALLAELQKGRLKAALDVTEPEPLPEDHELWRAPGVFITPHIAGSSQRFVERAFKLIRAQVVRYVAGEPLINRVEGGY